VLCFYEAGSEYAKNRVAMSLLTSVAMQLRSSLFRVLRCVLSSGVQRKISWSMWLFRRMGARLSSQIYDKRNKKFVVLGVASRVASD
jgi:hypothetical protein